MIQKKVLIITSNRSKTNDWAERERYVEEFYHNVEESLENTSVTYTTYNDITISVINNVVSMRDARHNLALEDLDLVHFKNWLFDNEHASLIAFYLKQKGVDFYNQEVDAGLAWGKISQMCRLAVGGVTVPDTFFVKKALLIQLLTESRLPSNFIFPLIMKADDGAKGDDNHLINTPEEAVGILRSAPSGKEYVIQNFLPNDGDYRFLFAGIDLPPLVFMRKAQEGTHLNNTSQGGSGSFVDVASLPKEYLVYARQAAQILKREISGVDILVDKSTRKPYVLEVNSTPAFATGYGVPQKQALFVNFIESHTALQEEE